MLPTPLDDATALAAALGGPRILVKRDDLTGLALGGNKARKLELLAADARRRRAPTCLVTGGGPQSNHARITAAAANRLGLDCHLVLAGPEPEPSSGNLLLDGSSARRSQFDASRRLLRHRGGDHRTPPHGSRPRADARIAIPIGGASVTGVVAYADAVDELRAQLDARSRLDRRRRRIGRHARGPPRGPRCDARTRVVGVDVGTRPDLDDAVPALAIEAAAQLRARRRPNRDGDRRPRPRRRRLRRALGARALDAITTRRARTEGLVLDPGVHGQGDGRAHHRGPRRAHRRRRDRGVLAHRRRARALRPVATQADAHGVGRDAERADPGRTRSSSVVDARQIDLGVAAHLVGDGGAERNQDQQQQELLHGEPSSAGWSRHCIPGVRAPAPRPDAFWQITPGGERGLVAPLVFNTSGTGDPRPVGSIPATSAIRHPNGSPVDHSSRVDVSRDRATLGQTAQTVGECVTT